MDSAVSTAGEMETVRCALCGCENSERYLQVCDPIRRGGPAYTFVKCPQCALVYLNPRPRTGDSPDSHPAEYWERKSHVQTERRGGPPRRFRRLWLRLLYSQEIRRVRRAVPPGARILEIGAGNGDFLSLLRGAGYSVTGLEPDPASFRVARAQYPDLDLRNTLVTAAQLPGESFDAVVMIHVFEHVAFPNETLREIRRILKPAGKLLLDLPNIECWQFRIFRQRYFNLCPPQHMYAYGPATLQAMLRKCGFVIRRISHQSLRSNGITLVCTVFPSLNPVSVAVARSRAAAGMKKALAYGLSLLGMPITCLEGFCRRGANLFVLAERSDR